MVVVGFSPKGEFSVRNSSPLGSLVVDDLDAKDTVSVHASGMGTTALLGKVDNVAVASCGSTGDILVDGVDKELSVDLQGTGNVVVAGTENVMITGELLGSAGVVAFTKGTCSVNTTFESGAGGNGMQGNESSLKEDDTAQDSNTRDSAMDESDNMDVSGIMTGCVKIPEGMSVEDAAPDVEQYMFWTCGIRVSGTFDCLRSAGVTMPNLAGDCSSPAFPPRGMGMSATRRVRGRAGHGPGIAPCREDITPEELSMTSLVEGLKLNVENEAELMVNESRQTNGRSFGVEESMESV
mmetsp:Transcript_23760/g.65922  ORF Transcript_23760/g.65922 Transcript_23760/m.65922 type:complete len:295 (-) Transcript_23760:195-1079(-)